LDASHPRTEEWDKHNATTPNPLFSTPRNQQLFGISSASASGESFEYAPVSQNEEDEIFAVEMVEVCAV
jgi:hypothetical protein